MLSWMVAVILACSTSQASMSTAQVKKEFHEPGHIPQGLKPKMYHPLNVVIPKEKQHKLKLRKHKKHSIQTWNVSTPSPSASPSLPSSVDLRKWDSPIRSQWDGTCTAHGLIASMENWVNRSQPNSFLSTRYFWSLYREYSAEVAIDTASESVQIDNRYWPQASSIPIYKRLSQYGKYELSDYDYLEDDTDLALKALSQDYPVYIAMQVPSDMASCRSTIRYSTRVVDGGHALEVVGYELDSSIAGGGYFILKNSWGTDCGDEGYQYLPIGLCNRNDMYCLFWSIKKVTIKK